MKTGVLFADDKFAIPKERRCRLPSGAGRMLSGIFAPFSSHTFQKNTSIGPIFCGKTTIVTYVSCEIGWKQKGLNKACLAGSAALKTTGGSLGKTKDNENNEDLLESPTWSRQKENAGVVTNVAKMAVRALPRRGEEA